MGSFASQPRGRVDALRRGAAVGRARQPAQPGTRRATRSGRLDDVSVADSLATEDVELTVLSDSQDVLGGDGTAWGKAGVVAARGAGGRSPDSLTLSATSAAGGAGDASWGHGQQDMSASALGTTGGWSAGGGQLGALGQSSASLESSDAVAHLRRVQGRLGELERQLRARH